MTTGKVKWFNNAKGYGFVLADASDEDLFVHYSSIEMNGYRTLRAGQEVSFDVVEGPKGLHAVNVCPLGGDGNGDPDDTHQHSARVEDGTAQADEDAIAQADEDGTAQADEDGTAQADEDATAQADEDATAQADDASTA